MKYSFIERKMVLFMSSEVTVRSVERAISILNCFSLANRELSLTQISSQVKLSPSTTLRLLTTLENGNYIRRNAQAGTYSLGWKLAQISSFAFSNLDVCTVSQPHLETIHNAFNESVGLYAPEGDKRICIARIDSSMSLRQCIVVGTVRPIDCGASGHVLMAYASQELKDRLVPHSRFCTYDFLELVRKRGYSVSNGEYAQGALSIAAPVFDSTGTAIAALFLTGPSGRADEQRLISYRDAIMQHAAMISRDLGYIPPEGNAP